MSESLIEKVQSLYAAFGRGDIQYIFDNLAEDVSWGLESVAKSEIPWYGVANSKAATAKFFQALGEGAEFHVFIPKDFVAAGDQVFNHLQYEATVKTTGKKVSMLSLQHWTFKNGKVVRWRGYEDTAAVRDAWRK